MSKPEEQDLESAFDEFAGDRPEQPRDEQGRFTEVPSGDNEEEPAEEIESEEELILEEENDPGGEVEGGPEPLPEAAEAEPETDWQKEAQNWEHRYKSNAGRVSAYQQKINEQQAEINQLKSNQTQSQSSGENPENSGLSDKEWDNLKQDFPEIAHAMEARLNHQNQQYQNQLQQQQQTINNLQQQLDPLVQNSQQQQRQAEFNTLAEKHADYKEVANSEEFANWLSTKPAGIQQLFYSESSGDAIYLLDTYKLETNSAQQPPAEQTDSGLRRKRQQQLERSQTIPARSGRKTPVAEDDMEAAFDYYADKAS